MPFLFRTKSLLLVIAAACILSIIIYPSIPSKIPIHWNASGDADWLVHKSIGLFILPTLMALLAWVQRSMFQIAYAIYFLAALHLIIVYISFTG